MEQGRSGRPVLVLVAPFPEGLESPAEPEKPIFNIRAYRVHKNLVRVSVFNNCAGATAAVWIQCTNTFPRRATSVLSGTVVKQEGGRHLLTSAAISSRFIQNPYQQVYFAYDCAMYPQVRPAKDAHKMYAPLNVSPKQ